MLNTAIDIKTSGSESRGQGFMLALYLYKINAFNDPLCSTDYAGIISGSLHPGLTSASRGNICMSHRLQTLRAIGHCF